MAALTYDQAIKDIVEFLGKGVTEEQVQCTMRMTRVCMEYLFTIVQTEGGYGLVTAFIVAWTEMQKVMVLAKGEDKKLIKELLEATLGSFGKTLN